MTNHQNDLHLVEAILDRYEQHIAGVTEILQVAEDRDEDVSAEELAKIKADTDALHVEVSELAERVTHPRAKAQLNEVLASWPKFGATSANYSSRSDANDGTVVILGPNGAELGRVFQSDTTSALLEHLCSPLLGGEGYQVSQSGAENDTTADLIAPDGVQVAKARTWDDGMSILTHLNRFHNGA